MKKLRSASLITGIAVTLALVATAANAVGPEGYPVQYSIKYVCGLVPVQPAGEESGVKPGNYATAINIHNYTDETINASARVTLHYRYGDPLPPAFYAQIRQAYRLRTLEIDCPDIWRMTNLPPETYLKGMLHLGLPQPLPIAAVYTSQTDLGPGTGLDPGAGISIDVEYIDPFLNQGF